MTGTVPALEQREFRALVELVRSESGIHLADSKRALVVSRLMRRLRERQLDSFAEYIRLVGSGGDREERIRMIDCICTNETQFFRHPRHFEWLEQRFGGDPLAQPPRPRLRVWSAACSTGEEAYSLAMCLGASAWSARGTRNGGAPAVDILATDLSTSALETAERAVYAIARARDIPSRHVKAFMLRGTGPSEGLMKAGPEIRALVRFQRWNLNDERTVPGAPFDVIFCRNVLIYFDAPTRARVAGRLVNQLTPGGHLFLGAAEGLGVHFEGARAVAPSVYMRVSKREKTALEKVTSHDS
ncbi:CheR family methyltransferase [Pendulispora albinea]|uniref:protein-glutamate O-methyltransferase n=1 Tax=Pendulispora albinea TaxID=2741071 RepID=A0ABZ2LQB5_9BACT